jgi:DNA polymerase
MLKLVNPELKGQKLEDAVDEKVKERIVRPWREAHPRTTAFWYELENACMDAVGSPGKIFSARAVSFKVNKNFLLCRLPSGRVLYYYDPDIRAMETSWGEMKDSVTYMTVDSLSKKWMRTGTYGGKLAENVTQAICRDIMAEAMLRLEGSGYPIVLTVHDEIIAEIPEDFGSVEEYERIMCVVPAWATGFPIQASGWRGKRYKK